MGKAFFANFETYYNERIRNELATPATAPTWLSGQTSYEKTIGALPRLQNSLPSIYGFLRLIDSEYWSATWQGGSSLQIMYAYLFNLYNQNFNNIKNMLGKMGMGNKKINMNLMKIPRKPTVILHLQKYVNKIQSSWRPYLFMKDNN